MALREIFMKQWELRSPLLGFPPGLKSIPRSTLSTLPMPGKAAASFCREENLRCKECEVMDIDEDAFRAGRVAARLYGYLNVPEFGSYFQSMKSGGYSEKVNWRGIAHEIVESMEQNVVYIIGSGTTPKAILDDLQLPQHCWVWMQ